jgi:hypothetical protein
VRVNFLFRLWLEVAGEGDHRVGQSFFGAGLQRFYGCLRAAADDLGSQQLSFGLLFENLEDSFAVRSRRPEHRRAKALLDAVTDVMPHTFFVQSFEVRCVGRCQKAAESLQMLTRPPSSGSLSFVRSR